MRKSKKCRSKMMMSARKQRRSRKKPLSIKKFLGGITKKSVYCIIDGNNYLSGHYEYNPNFSYNDVMKAFINIIDLFVDIDSPDFDIHIVLVNTYPTHKDQKFRDTSKKLINQFRYKKRAKTDSGKVLFLKFDQCFIDKTNRQKDCDLKIGNNLVENYFLNDQENVTNIILISGDQDFLSVLDLIEKHKHKSRNDIKINIVAFKNRFSPYYLESGYRFTKIDENPKDVIVWDGGPNFITEEPGNNLEAANRLYNQFHSSQSLSTPVSTSPIPPSNLPQSPHTPPPPTIYYPSSPPAPRHHYPPPSPPPPLLPPPPSRFRYSQPPPPPPPASR